MNQDDEFDLTEDQVDAMMATGQPVELGGPPGVIVLDGARVVCEGNTVIRP